MATWCLALTTAFTSQAFAIDETETGLPVAEGGLQLSLSREWYEGNVTGRNFVETWVGARSGAVRAATTTDFKKHRIQVSAGLRDFYDHAALQPFYFEGYTESGKPAYALLGLEVPLIRPLTVFGAVAYNQKHQFRFLGGPVFYWKDSHSSLFFYGSGDLEGQVRTLGAVTLRNRLRGFGKVGMDLDVSAKIVDVKGEPQTAFGGKAGVAFGPLSLSAQLAPFYEGSELNRLQAVVGLATGI